MTAESAQRKSELSEGRNNRDDFRGASTATSIPLDELSKVPNVAIISSERGHSDAAAIHPDEIGKKTPMNTELPFPIN